MGALSFERLPLGIQLGRPAADLLDLTAKLLLQLHSLRSPLLLPPLELLQPPVQVGHLFGKLRPGFRDSLDRMIVSLLILQRLVLGIQLSPLGRYLLGLNLESLLQLRPVGLPLSLLKLKPLDLILDYAFNILRLHQLYSNVTATNKASLELFKKKHFTVIGVKKEWLRIKDSWCDEYMMQLINVQA